MAALESGALQVLRFNWPRYAAAVAVAAAAAVALSTPLPQAVRAGLAATAAGTLYWSAASLTASWWVYDRSGLRDWTWIAPHLSRPPRRWAVLHAGLDEASGAIARLYPGGRGTVVDIFDPGSMPGRSIRRARGAHAPPSPAMGQAARLPFAEGELDAAFIIFAAHEILRPGDRTRLFRDVHHALRPGGKVLVVEHVRDCANFLAFGPGFLHFLPRAEWLRVAGDSGLVAVRESRFTPLVRVFLWRKP
jgi:SAM-dependent methyltransferase